MKGLGKFETYLITSESTNTITNFIKEKKAISPFGFALWGFAKAGVTRATKLLQLATKSDFNAC
jgi:hypothetical protein